MAVFKYKALDRNGVAVSGELDALSETEAFETLKRRRLEAFEIGVKPESSELFGGTRRVKPKDLARYVRQLATLLSAGVTLLDALGSLSRSNAHPKLAQASNAIRKDLRAGARLSVAMGSHLPQLPRYVPRLAELGEATGQSAKALSDAAERMEYEDQMRSEISTALGAGVGLKNNLLPVLLAFAALIGGGIYISRSDSLKANLRSWLERLPIVGPVLVQSERAAARGYADCAQRNSRGPQY